MAAADTTPPPFTTNRCVANTFAISKAADFWIKVEDETIAVHKDLLISTVPYFQWLFDSGMQEVQNQTLEIDCFRPIVVKTVIKYIYGKRADFEWEDIVDYVDLAESWQFAELKNELAGYVSQNIRADKCIYWMFMAQKYSLSDVTLYATRHLSTHSTSITARPEFLQLDFSQLLELLCDGVKINTSCEAKLIACINWVRADETSRMCHYTALLEHLGLQFCSREFIQVVVQVYRRVAKVDDDVIHRYMHPLLTLVENESKKKERKKGQSVLVIDNSRNTKAMTINLNDLSAEVVHAIPTDFSMLSFRCWTPYGIFTSKRGSNVASAASRDVLLDGSTMSYVNIPGFSHRVINRRAVYSDDRVFFCDMERGLKVIWILDMRTLQWTCSSTPPRDLFRPVMPIIMVCAAESRIYLQAEKTLYIYDIESDGWSDECEFLRGRRTLSLVSAVQLAGPYPYYNHQIGHLPPHVINRRPPPQLVDGFNLVIGSLEYARLLYNRIIDGWIIFYQLPDGYASYATTCIDGKIIFTGIPATGNDSLHVLFYKPERDEWETNSVKCPLGFSWEPTIIPDIQVWPI